VIAVIARDLVIGEIAATADIAVIGKPVVAALEGAHQPRTKSQQPRAETP